jgi:hypothetical protein
VSAFSKSRCFLPAATRLIAIGLCTAALWFSTSGQKQLTLRTEQILEAEQRLAELGFWTGPVDGVPDEASRSAVVAFQKAERQPCTGKLTVQALESMRSSKPIRPREPGYQHVEVDLTRQILFVVDTENKATRILPISSGTGQLFTADGWTRRAITPTGRFMVYRKMAGWRKSPLGILYYPNYIVGGVAIHGNPSVPRTPASHGCIRIPMFAAVEFSKSVPIGMIVLVYSDLDERDTP